VAIGKFERRAPGVAVRLPINRDARRAIERDTFAALDAAAA
jgi:hypothetical protein